METFYWIILASTTKRECWSANDFFKMSASVRPSVPHVASARPSVRPSRKSFDLGQVKEWQRNTIPRSKEDDAARKREERSKLARATSTPKSKEDDAALPRSKEDDAARKRKGRSVATRSVNNFELLSRHSACMARPDEQFHISFVND